MLALNHLFHACITSQTIELLLPKQIPFCFSASVFLSLQLRQEADQRNAQLQAAEGRVAELQRALHTVCVCVCCVRVFAAVFLDPVFSFDIVPDRHFLLYTPKTIKCV